MTALDAVVVSHPHLDHIGGLPAVLREIAPHLHVNALTVNGKTIGENIERARCWNREVIKTLADPFKADAGIAVLKGNLAPQGAGRTSVGVRINKLFYFKGAVRVARFTRRALPPSEFLKLD